MAFIVVEKGNSQDVGKTFSVGEKALVIGRETPESSPAIVLHDEYVSRNHAEIVLDQNRLLVRDLHSTNGTTIDGVRMEPGKSYPLKNGSTIGLGITSEGARVVLKFKESMISTARLEETKTNDISAIGWLRIDQDKGEVWVDEKQLVLSRKEYDLILCLRRAAGRVCRRDELVSSIWPEVVNAAGVSDAAIDQLVHRVRLKIEPDPSRPRRLVSRKGFGYVLV